MTKSDMLADLTAHITECNYLDVLCHDHRILFEDLMALIGRTREYAAFNRLHSKHISQERGLPKPEPASWWTAEHKQMAADCYNGGMDPRHVAKKIQQTYASTRYNLEIMRIAGWKLRKPIHGRKKGGVNALHRAG